jgi:hypothetical protein
VGAVVRAESEEQARRIAAERLPGDQPGDEFLRPDRSTCVPVEAEGEAGVVLSSFNAG